MFRSSIVSALVLVALTGCQSTSTSIQKDANNLNKQFEIDVNNTTYNMAFDHSQSMVTSVEYISREQSKGIYTKKAKSGLWSQEKVEHQTQLLNSLYSNGAFIVRVYGETINSVSRDLYKVKLVQDGKVVQRGVFDAVGDVPNMDYPSRLWRNDSKLATNGLDTSEPFEIQVITGENIERYHYQPNAKG
ncbi:hypothetical protein ABF162_19175 [Vibrio coralliilyticus]|uniref:hypothetical protein n=1 Tax=Vibrio coralliilyticus TaxID=190893 RepID=UPI001F2A6841|nr:hypothetical protein [Vibrio coralliilyticus]